MSISVVDEEGLEEEEDVGSFYHASVQVNLAHLLKKLGNYRVCTELSLDIAKVDLKQFGVDFKNEAKPDVCIYHKRSLKESDDILRMSEMPLLAIEILSPMQGVYKIIQKFKLYFEMGIQSCWLVEPITQVVHVYPSPYHHKTFTIQNKEVFDETLKISIPFSEIFE